MLGQNPNDYFTGDHTFLCFRQVLASLEGAVLATFFDLYENVSIVGSSVVCRWCFMMRNKTGLFLRVLVEFQT